MSFNETRLPLTYFFAECREVLLARIFSTQGSHNLKLNTKRRFCFHFVHSRSRQCCVVISKTRSTTFKRLCSGKTMTSTICIQGSQTEDVAPTIMVGSDQNSNNVFDLSAMIMIQSSRAGERSHGNCQVIEEDEQQKQKHQQEELPSCYTSPSRSPPPPLESLTAFTDDDSVSSVSTQGSASVIYTQQRRAVFSQYWKKTGQEILPQLPRIRRSADVLVTDTAATRSSSSSTEPRVSASSSSLLSDVPENRLMFLSTQPENEVVLDVEIPEELPVSTTSYGLRRSILPTPPRSNSVPCQLSSYPSFLSVATTTSGIATTDTTSSSFSTRPLVTRKTQSSPHLGQKQPGASCLRESRFSPVKASTSSSSICSASSYSRHTMTTDQSSITSSVRFDMDAVAVRHFEPPKEKYAEEGWAQYFF